MFPGFQKRLRSFSILLLSFIISASVVICPCPVSSSSEHHRDVAQKEEAHSHEEKTNNSHDESKHQGSKHACLCDNGTVAGYLTQAEKTPLKTDFLVAVLNQFQVSFPFSHSSTQFFHLTHSPPQKNRPLYITQLTLLI